MLTPVGEYANVLQEKQVSSKKQEASSWPGSFSALQMEMRIVLRNLKS